LSISKKGFTLIELLIVVAIIAILAAIAVPNFLDAQVRAKVSASRADLRSLALAVESYMVDWNEYPNYPCDFGVCQHFIDTGYLGSDNPETVELLMGYTPVSLSTPLAYMTTLPKDKFVYAEASGAREPNALQLYHYEQHESPVMFGFWIRRAPQGIKYVMWGVGPDGWTGSSSNIEAGSFHNNVVEFLMIHKGLVSFYDPTNGTVSPGDIIYHGPGLGFDPSKTINPGEQGN
jgi:prepilin-type N-terminal cleavage/methylation domain-containing protein